MGFCRALPSGMRTGEPVVREEIVVGKNGQRYWSKVLSNPVPDGDGAWQYTVTTLTDITTSKMHEVLQRRVLEAMARDCPLVEVLEMVCEEVERMAPEVTGLRAGGGCGRQVAPLGQPLFARVLFHAAVRGADRPLCRVSRHRRMAQRACGGA